MKKISLLGCGWLGLPLAKSLIEKGFLVKGSTTSSAKISILEKAGIEPFLLELSETGINGDISSFLENSEFLILDIPPKLRGLQKENFVTKIENLIPYIEKSSIGKVLFVSSTSVYSDTNSVKLITEETIPYPETESGKQLLEAEQLLQNNTSFKTTVVRFGGLIGENRHPIHFLVGRQHIENPDSPINLIHQLDCIVIIQAILMKNYFGEIVNAVAPFHPNRATYYTQKAIELNLPLPEFDQSKPSFGKTISSEKIERVLNYTFQKPQL
ncbi:SDR family NAD(P)-dependent oxidoreductase [Flavobacterium sp. RSB2_4_14]|uniref:SDR family NAD(P)-dependent oxidoreductase n=1 Tax=Flavobacterium sp. RSB2_4_14 TaxID=3447665 RepID=UPI003F3FCA56